MNIISGSHKNRKPYERYCLYVNNNSIYVRQKNKCKQKQKTSGMKLGNNQQSKNICVSGAAARTGIGEKEENIKIIRIMDCGIEKKIQSRK